MDYSQVYDRVEQSVLQIVQLDGKSEMISRASGCIVGNGHFVLTCSHCCNTISCLFNLGRVEKLNNPIYMYF